jgi:hypothetical protein
MYNKLARGHATALMNSHQQFDLIGQWFRTGKYDALMGRIDICARSKNPERPMKHINALLTPAFERGRVIEWEKHNKWVSSKSYTLARNVSVKASSENPGMGFVEDEIFLNRLDIIVRRHESAVRFFIPASITRHALTRLLERKACTPAELGSTMGDAMGCAYKVACSIFRTQRYVDGTYNFLIPFMGGALVAHNYPFEAVTIGIPIKSENCSIRTWLSPDMISSDMRKRMVEWSMFVERDDRSCADEFDDIIWRNSRVLERDCADRLPILNTAKTKAA